MRFAFYVLIPMPYALSPMPRAICLFFCFRSMRYAIFHVILGVPISFSFLYNPAELKELLTPRRKVRQGAKEIRNSGFVKRF
jgi:hypothetical protein